MTILRVKSIIKAIRANGKQGYLIKLKIKFKQIAISIRQAQSNLMEE